MLMHWYFDTYVYINVRKMFICSREIQTQNDRIQHVNDVQANGYTLSHILNQYEQHAWSRFRQCKVRRKGAHACSAVLMKTEMIIENQTPYVKYVRLSFLHISFCSICACTFNWWCWRLILIVCNHILYVTERRRPLTYSN